MTDKTYNGWTNYATWRVALEIFDGLAVTCHRYNGRLRYMCALSSLDARWAGEAQ